MLNGLTTKREHFVQELVAGKSQRDAYKAAFKCERMKDKTIDEAASRLLKDSKVAARHEELMTKVIAKAEEGTIATAQEVLQYLTATMRNELLEEVVVVDGFVGAHKVKKEVSIKDRNKAAELLAKKYGILTEKMQLDVMPTVISGEDDLE